jgi:hypothetical protein
MKIQEILTESERQELINAYELSPSYFRLLQISKYPNTLLKGEKEEFKEYYSLVEAIRDPNLSTLFADWYARFSYSYAELKTNKIYPTVIEITAIEMPQVRKADLYVNLVQNPTLIKKVKPKKFLLNDIWLRHQEFDFSRSTHYFFLKNIDLQDFIDLINFSRPAGFSISINYVSDFKSKI